MVVGVVKPVVGVENSGLGLGVIGERGEGVASGPKWEA